jgi:hypothetical protein
MGGTPMMTFKQFFRSLNPPYLDEVFLTDDGATAQCLREGQWMALSW